MSLKGRKFKFNDTITQYNETSAFFGFGSMNSFVIASNYTQYNGITCILDSNNIMLVYEAHGSNRFLAYNEEIWEESGKIFEFIEEPDLMVIDGESVTFSEEIVLTWLNANATEIIPYSPTKWKAGDVVTSAKLNNIEQGVQEAIDLAGDASDGAYSAMVQFGRPVLISNLENNQFLMFDGDVWTNTALPKKNILEIADISGVLQMTYAQISSYISAGWDIWVRRELTTASGNYQWCPVIRKYESNDTYFIECKAGSNTEQYSCNSTDSYPAYIQPK